MNQINNSVKTSESIANHWKFLGTSLWGILVAAIFFVLQGAATFFVVLNRRDNLTDQQFQDFIAAAHDNGVIISIATFVTTIFCSAIVVGIIKLKRGSHLADYLALRRVPIKTFLIWLGVTAIFMVASDSFTVMLGRPIVPPSVAKAYASTHPIWLIWVALIIAAPLFEEIFFRGFLFKGFSESVIGPVGTIALTAFLWAIIHAQYDAYGVATIFCVGIIFGVARWRTRSLWVPIAMHSLMNFGAAVEAALFR